MFIDSAVSGVHYVTKNSNGVTTHTGITNSAGEYSYEPGDSIIFYMGGIASPGSMASGVITPLSLCQKADFNDNCVVNLARLLQTLDTDSDASNGITIDTALVDAITVGLASDAIDFTLSPSAFEADQTVAAVVTHGGGSTTLVSAVDAVAHVKSQTLVGSWQLATGTHSGIVTFFADGSYVDAEQLLSGSVGNSGIESGSYTWNAATGAFTANIAVDTNGGFGFSNSPSGNNLTISGDTATFTDNASNAVMLTRLPLVSNASAIVGTWYAFESDAHVVLTFLGDGTYVHAQDGGDVNGTPGVEFGTYSWDSGSGVISASPSIDTNGEWGLSHPQGALAINISGDTLTATDSGAPSDSSTLTRLIP